MTLRQQGEKHKLEQRGKGEPQQQINMGLGKKEKEVLQQHTGLIRVDVAEVARDGLAKVGDSTQRLPVTDVD